MCVNDIVVSGAGPSSSSTTSAPASSHRPTAESSRASPPPARSRLRAHRRRDRRAARLLRGGEYDLAGFAVGVVEKQRIIDGRRSARATSSSASASSGLHTQRVLPRPQGAAGSRRHRSQPAPRGTRPPPGRGTPRAHPPLPAARPRGDARRGPAPARRQPHPPAAAGPTTSPASSRTACAPCLRPRDGPGPADLRARPARLAASRQTRCTAFQHGHRHGAGRGPRPTRPAAVATLGLARPARRGRSAPIAARAGDAPQAVVA